MTSLSLAQHYCYKIFSSPLRNYSFANWPSSFIYFIFRFPCQPNPRSYFFFSLFPHSLYLLFLSPMSDLVGLKECQLLKCEQIATNKTLLAAFGQTQTMFFPFHFSLSLQEACIAYFFRHYTTFGNAFYKLVAARTEKHTFILCFFDLTDFACYALLIFVPLSSSRLAAHCIERQCSPSGTDRGEMH